MTEEKELSKNFNSKENKILVSFVNEHFGPIRGLNFIIHGEQRFEIEKYIDEQPKHVIDEIYKETLLSAMAIQLPIELTEEMETPPQVVNSIEEGERIIKQNVEKGSLSGDPFYFRSFIY
jgi:hypothetical protein